MPDGADTPFPLRIVPVNEDAEMALLGALLHSNRAYERVADFLLPEHFGIRVHGDIYAAIALLIDRGQIADPIRLKQYFETDERLAEVGGYAYLMRLAGSVASIVNAEDYGRTVHDLHLRRELIVLSEDMAARAYARDMTDLATDQIESTEQRLSALADNGTESTEHTFAQALQRTMRSAQDAYRHEGRMVGLSSGFLDLDRLLGGLHPTDLVILAGRPSMGKTALATNMAFHAAQLAAEQEGRPVVAFFSLEMSAEQLSTRMLSEQTSIPSERIRRGELSAQEFDELAAMAQQLERLPLVIDDGAGATVAQIRNKARRLKRKNKGRLALVVVDYLQLMSGGKGAQGNRVEIVSDITRGLKLVAKELNVPVLALSQLSRQVESRDDKRPQLSDLRESGSIEQDADVVMFVYRDEYYLARREPREGTPEHAAWDEEMDKVRNLAEILIGKQRHGPIGKVVLQFQAEVTRFANYTPSRWS